MQYASRRLALGRMILAAVMLMSLACGFNLDSPPPPVPTTAAPPPPTVVLPQPTTQDNKQPPEVTVQGTPPQPTVQATQPLPTVQIPSVTAAPTVGAEAQPAKDPCGLPGTQLRANFAAAAGSTNALTANFSGDMQVVSPAGKPSIISNQQASVQRKFVILLPNLMPATYDLSTTYLSYTEKTNDSDKTPRIWQASSGYLQVGLCDSGGMALRTVADATTLVGEAVAFGPLSAPNNPATGKLLIGIGAKFR